VGLTTPKQVARSLVAYGKSHPEVDMSAFVIPQVAGSVKRSHPVDGVAESLVKTKKYLLPLAVLTPEVTGGIVIAYLTDGRMKLPRNAAVFNVEEEEIQPLQASPANGTGPLANPAPASPTARTSGSASF
jgi:hypothetical protein